MTYEYKITGMTCNGCVASVEKKLSEIENINKVSADLESSKVKIVASHEVDFNMLTRALTEKYSLEKEEEQNIFSTQRKTNTKETSELQQLFPLFLIFAFITGASILLNISPFDFENAMLDFMGLFYVVFSFFKFLDLKGFPKSFAMYDPLAKALPVYGWVYPFMELGLGLLFLMRFQVPVALITTLIILGITTIGVTKALLGKDSIQCACLGTALKLPMTKATFIENTIMITMAIIMIFKLNVL